MLRFPARTTDTELTVVDGVDDAVVADAKAAAFRLWHKCGGVQPIGSFSGSVSSVGMRRAEARGIPEALQDQSGRFAAKIQSKPS